MEGLNTQNFPWHRYKTLELNSLRLGFLWQEIDAVWICSNKMLMCMMLFKHIKRVAKNPCSMFLNLPSEVTKASENWATRTQRKSRLSKVFTVILLYGTLYFLRDDNRNTYTMKVLWPNLTLHNKAPTDDLYFWANSMGNPVFVQNKAK